MRAHGAVASKELGKKVVAAVLADWRTAPLSPKLHAMLGYLETLCLRPEQLGAQDLLPLRAEGLSDQAIEDAIAVCAAFQVIIRIADALEFYVPDEADFDKAADGMLSRGYRM